MYKVFFNEKSISVTNSKNNDAININYLSNEDFPKFWELLNNEDTSLINLHNDDVEALWELFKLNFKTVKAAGGLVKNKNNEYLFIYRLEKWDLPKGKIEESEKKKEAALREVEEECGINNLILNEKITTTYHIYISQKGNICLKPTYWYTMEYHGTALPKPQIEEGISKVEWKSSEEIQSSVLSQTFENIKLVLKSVNLY